MHALTRRTLLARTAGLAASAATLSLLDVGPLVRGAYAASVEQTNATRAIAAYDAMQKYYYANDGSTPTTAPLCTGRSTRSPAATPSTGPSPRR